MSHKNEMDWQRTFNVAFVTCIFIFIAAMLGFLMALFLPRPSWAAWVNVAAEWDQYRLNETQKQWFKSVTPKRPGPRCCDIADGHPTQQDHRVDGWYIPNPFHTDWDWVRVPDDAFTVPGSNPVGVATVWYAVQSNPDGTPYIRCFVPEAET
jgi:hypothetical protein